MSKIVVLLRSADPQAIKIVRDATGASWSEISARVRERRPAAEFRLFLNEHEEVAQRLRRLIAQLGDHGVAAEFFELSAEETFETTSDLEACRMTADVVENTLRRHEEGVERLKRRDDEGR